MKRFALIIATVAALAFVPTSSANAFESYYGHGGHHGRASHGFVGASYGHGLSQHGYAGHGYAAPSFGHGYAQHGYAAPAYGGHGFNRFYGHRGGLRISTPLFGLRLGH